MSKVMRSGWAALVAGVVVASLAAVVSAPSPAPAVDVEDGLTLTTTALPPVPDSLPIIGLGLDGAWAYAGLRTGTDEGTLYRTSSDGSGSWQPVVDPVTELPLVFVATLPPTVDSGIVLAAVPGDPCATRLITGPSSARTLASCGGWELALGGQAVTHVEPYIPFPWRVENLDGTVLESSPGETLSDEAPSVDHGMLALFTVPGGETLERRPVGAPSPSLLQKLPSGCQAFRVSLRDQYAVAPCPSGGASALLRSDVPLAPEPLPSRGWRTGEGFVVRQPGPYEPNPTDVEVLDLGAGHATVRLPAVKGALPAPDRQDSPSFVMRSGPASVQVVTVTGLQPPSTEPDTTAPVIEGLTDPGPAVAVDGGNPTLWWSGRDPGKVGDLVYDVQRISWRPDQPQPAWPSTSSSDRTLQDSGALYGEPGANACLRVRAVDWAGNQGQWQTRCTFLDGAVPMVDWPLILPSVMGRHQGPSTQPVRVAWTGSDDDPSAHFDLDYRLAPLGRRAGSRVSPTAWNALPMTTLSASKRFPAGSTVCFLLRADDRSGRSEVARFQPTLCRTVPLDDRALALRGTASRTSRARAYSGTVTLLRAPKDAMVRPGMLVDSVQLRVLGAPLGRCPVVTVGSTARVACMKRPDGAATIYWYLFPKATRGTLRIRLAAPVRGGALVDAVYATHG